jgi:hypothetical protein
MSNKTKPFEPKAGEIGIAVVVAEEAVGSAVFVLIILPKPVW